jgi:hypothetical protein
MRSSVKKIGWRILFLFVFVLPAASPSRAAEDPTVLVVRPERLSGWADNTGMGFQIRDPFNWPADHIAERRDQETQVNDIFADISLGGIIWNEKEPLAIINKKLVGKGDKAGEATVEDIRKETVILSHKGLTHTLRIEKPLLTASDPEFSFHIRKLNLPPDFSFDSP